jgi:hypothetical protein
VLTDGKSVERSVGILNARSHSVSIAGSPPGVIAQILNSPAESFVTLASVVFPALGYTSDVTRIAAEASSSGGCRDVLAAGLAERIDVTVEPLALAVLRSYQIDAEEKAIAAAAKVGFDDELRGKFEAQRASLLARQAARSSLRSASSASSDAATMSTGESAETGENDETSVSGESEETPESPPFENYESPDSPLMGAGSRGDGLDYVGRLGDGGIAQMSIVERRDTTDGFDVPTLIDKLEASLRQEIEQR